MSEHPWMEHQVTKGRAQLPDLPYWRALGWNPCDGPPPEPDLLHDPQPEPEPEPVKPAAGKPAVDEKKVTRG